MVNESLNGLWPFIFHFIQFYVKLEKFDSSETTETNFIKLGHNHH